ncbi:MAG: ATP-binding protein [Oscillospiraceae bacterium]|nr:ATP-binding protein [Clostridia bacterium]MBQ9168173.1 ATP-binding protein [Oscillospiraceae bacterium]
MSSDLQLLESIASANYFVDKTYLDELTIYAPCALSKNDKQNRFLRFCQIEKIMYDADEDVNDKLISVYGALAQFVNDVILLIVGSKTDVKLYIGIRSKRNIAVAGHIMHDAFMANFPGSTLKPIVDIEDGKRIIATALNNTVIDDEIDLNVGCVNVIPSLRGDKSETFVQGLEKFIDTMRGEEYACQIIASPISNGELESRRKGYEDIYSALSPFAKKSMAHGHNYGETLTEGISESISSSISKGISMATGTSSGYSKGKQSGFTMGAQMLVNFGFNQSTTEAVNSGKTKTETEQETETEQTGTTTQKTETVSTGTTDTITTEYRDKAIEDLLEKIDLNITRYKESASYGLWDCAAYIISPDKKTVAIGCSTFKSLMLGEQSRVERTHINLFSSENTEVTDIILESLRYCEHPKFKIPASVTSEEQIIRSANAVSGREMAIYMSLPRKSIPGLMVSEMAEFGRNVFSTASVSDRFIHAGNVYHMDQVEHTDVDLSVDSLTAHCFITGSTGSGKSNTVYTLLEQLSIAPHEINKMVQLYDKLGSYAAVAEEVNRSEAYVEKHVKLAKKRPNLASPIPFLVIEPAKGEYRREFGGVPGITVFCTNSTHGQLLKINPFYFNPQIHVLEHLDRLVEIFNACWEMYAAMPAILKDAIERAYINKGWDLLNSVFIKPGTPVYPTFSDLLIELPKVIDKSGYSADTKGDYTGALVTRVQSLTNGIYGQIFCDDFDIDESTMFDQNTIIDLSRVGSTETKSLIMGMIVLRLTEYRMSSNIPMNSALRHITILEEAHNLLKNTNNVRGTAGNQVVAKSVEMIVNSIAEMRTYGEGFIIVDQSPTSVDIAAVKNTNTKIIMRLPEKDDCDLVGRAVSLTEKQISELSKLKVGVAVVMQNNWTEAVLAKIDPAAHLHQVEPSLVSYDAMKAFRSRVLTALLDEFALSDSYNVGRIIQLIEQFDIRIEFKQEMERYIRALCGRMNSCFDSLVFGRSLKRLAGCTDAFKMSASKLKANPAPATDVPYYTSESVSEWRKNIGDNINEYVELDERHRNILIQYIVYAQRFEKHDIDYDALYNEVYQVR